MRGTESEYLGLGYILEKATDPSRIRMIQWDIKAKIAREDTEEDKVEARRLIARGREEARGND